MFCGRVVEAAVEILDHGRCVVPLGYWIHTRGWHHFTYEISSDQECGGGRLRQKVRFRAVNYLSSVACIVSRAEFFSTNGGTSDQEPGGKRRSAGCSGPGRKRGRAA